MRVWGLFYISKSCPFSAIDTTKVVINTGGRFFCVVSLKKNNICYNTKEPSPCVKALKEDLFLPLEKGEFYGVTSVLTIAELLVRPKALQREDVAEEYTLLLSTYPNLEIVPFTLTLAASCAEIRAGYKLRTPDAIQAATALEKKATLFLTNDAGFPSRIGQMTIRVLSDFLGEK